MRSRYLRALLSVVPLLMAAMLFGLPGRVHAEGLQIRPLLYRQTLQPGEVKRGYVDVSNAENVPVSLGLGVRSFRQIDDQGDLRFKDSDALRSGIRLDLDAVDLGPHEAVRVYFIVDSSKLPAGDIFAAIFATTRADAEAGLVPAAQVGSLLVLQNGTGGPRKASITGLSATVIQFSDTVSADVRIHNDGPPGEATAFFPHIQTALGPLGKVQGKTEGPLIFAGITRTARVSVPSHNRLGFYRLSVSVGGAHADRWLLLVTGFWRWVFVAAGIAAVIFVLLRKRPYPRTYLRKPLKWHRPETANGPVSAATMHPSEVSLEALGDVREAPSGASHAGNKPLGPSASDAVPAARKQAAIRTSNRPEEKGKKLKHQHKNKSKKAKNVKNTTSVKNKR